MKENYEILLKPARLRKSSRGERSILDESESDRARVLYSASFRRLQRKTQVFPLEENAAIRSRLTHSLEVAHVGRYLATSFLKRLDEPVVNGVTRRSLGISDDCALAIPNVVETACLLHDIGNPPFGHFGEAAISNWFRQVWPKYKKKLFERNTKADEIAHDFYEFDGNPQGFRIITRLSGVDSFGLNLTVAQIASTVKYPIVPIRINKSRDLTKKAGIFASEAQIWTDVCDGLDLQNGTRFPLAYLMEAADDISYCLSDIEDGIEKGFIRHKQFVSDVYDSLSDNKTALAIVAKAKKQSEDYASEVDPTVSFRSSLVTEMVKQVSRDYVINHKSIFDGEPDGLIVDGSDTDLILTAVRNTVSSQLYGHRSSHELELMGHAAIIGILRRYEKILDLNRGEFEELSNDKTRSRLFEEEKRLYSLMPSKHVACYKDPNNADCSELDEWMARVHLITDFVAGMTDSYALSTYQMLAGIRV